MGKTAPAAPSAPGSPVHPHRCGENCWLLKQGLITGGSPPQVWGKLALAIKCLPHIRFTPTGVGKTVVKYNPRSNPMVHPHRCGENSQRVVSGCPSNGSPPQVWGKLSPSAAGGPSSRFTPTGVGKTWMHVIPADSVPVHPHRCGENTSARLCKNCAIGSPPQVWGKRAFQALVLEQQRFTPTGVGKTDSHGWGRDSHGVHPHRCGENEWRVRIAGRLDGSPPQVWGKLAKARASNRRARFTPTGVGKTS